MRFSLSASWAMEVATEMKFGTKLASGWGWCSNFESPIAQRKRTIPHSTMKNMMCVVVMVLCNQAKAFALDLGDDQSHYLLFNWSAFHSSLRLVQFQKVFQMGTFRYCRRRIFCDPHAFCVLQLQYCSTVGDAFIVIMLMIIQTSVDIFDVIRLKICWCVISRMNKKWNSYHLCVLL